MHLVGISRFNEETNHGTLKHHDISDQGICLLLTLNMSSNKPSCTHAAEIETEINAMLSTS